MSPCRFLPSLIVSGILVLGCRREAEDSARDSWNRLGSLAEQLETGLVRTEAECVRVAEVFRGVYGRLDELASEAEGSAYVLEDNGILHKPGAVAEDRAAVFVSGAVPVDERIRRVVRATEAADPELKRVVVENEQVVQAYFNDNNSFNRIYPPFDVVMQYPPGMVIPEYNFYYLADDEHNPERLPVWVKEPYVDPAGRGWMVSCVAPVHWNGSLQGVAGLDITIEMLVRDLEFEQENRFCLLLAEDGTVVATGEALIQVLRLPPLKNHRYVDTVRADTFRSDQYNLRKSSSEAIRRMASEVLADGGEDRGQTLLSLDDREWTVRFRKIRNLGWRLISFSLNE